MIKPRPYQSKAVAATFRYLIDNPDKHPVIGAPTGSGKSIIIAMIIEKTLLKWPNTHILIISHVKEIVDQNAKAITKLLPNITVGLYSSGLGVKDRQQVTVAGIQSIYRKSDEFKDYGLVIIDEAHTIPLSGSGMYRTFFNGIGRARYIGLTATPYRLGGGYIYGKDRLFDDLSYDLTSSENFKKLTSDGYLSKLKSIGTEIELKTDRDIRTQNGDFKITDLSHKFDRQPITDAAIAEVIKHGADYKKWLIFAIDIDHAEHIAETLIRNNIMTQVVHSKMDDDRDAIIRKYKAGKYKAMVNVNVLTTGFDDPEIDLIVLLRPTKSPVLHVQMIGRGLRIAPNKPHCLVMDFGGNIDRLGPIDCVDVREKRKGKGGDPITKRCPVCNTIHHPAVRICEFCDHEFEFKHGLNNASGKSVVTDDSRWFIIRSVQYHISTKPNRPDSLLVTYQCGLTFFKEWVNPEHPGYAGHMGRHWLKFRGLEVTTTKEAFEQSRKIKVPKRIKVNQRGKYPQIDDYEF